MLFTNYSIEKGSIFNRPILFAFLLVTIDDFKNRNTNIN